MFAGTAMGTLPQMERLSIPFNISEIQIHGCDLKVSDFQKSKQNMRFKQILS